jgi:Peptidase family M23
MGMRSLPFASMTFAVAQRGIAALLMWMLIVPATSRTVSIPLADGFDFPVGKPNATSYYKARGFTQNGHRGEDWNGKGGGNTDLGDPVYSTADGVIVFSQDIRQGWGNMIIIRHALRDVDGQIVMVDSLYGHLDKRLGKKDQVVKKGEVIGTIGTNYGMYAAHLHFEIHKNLEMGPNRTGYAATYANYYNPTPYINARRQLNSNFRTYAAIVDTFGGYYKGKSTPRVIPSKETMGLSSGGTEVSDKKARLDALIEQNKRKAKGLTNEDEDSFWEMLKNKLRPATPSADATTAAKPPVPVPPAKPTPAKPTPKKK